MNAHVYAEALKEVRGGLKCELLRIGDHTAHIVGQPAVGIGNKAAALKEEDLRGLIQAADSGRGCCAAGHAAHNHYFHKTHPFCLPVKDGMHPNALIIAENHAHEEPNTRIENVSFRPEGRGCARPLFFSVPVRTPF